MLILEFDFRADGVARYANNSNYRNDSLIRKESTSPALPPLLCTPLFEPLSISGVLRCGVFMVVCVSPALIQELKRIVQDSEIMKYAPHLGERVDYQGRRCQVAQEE